MGLFALALPVLLLGKYFRKREDTYDPEKAVERHAERPNHGDPTDTGPDDSHDRSSPDALDINPRHRRVRHVPSNVTPPVFTHPNVSSDDVTLHKPTLRSRIMAYVWPSDDHSSDIDAFVPNYRWTPIISGIVIPFSILLEIPGLTEHWYIRTEDNKTVESRPNPVILDVGLGFSIACALVANTCLILRFLEKRVQTVTLLCIVSLTVHDVINIITVTVFGVEHRFDDGFTYGDAFWMTLCSTIASTITNISLIVDLIRTPDFAKRGSGLTRKQRALMIIVIVLLVYIALGALINSLLLELTFINGLYFSVVSIETIGFGDIVPKSTGARVWTCVYVVFGVINIGVVIAMCRETVLEGLEIGYRRRIRDMRERRRDAKRFRHWELRWQRAVEFRLRDAGKPIWVPDDKPLQDEDSSSNGLLGRLPRIKAPFFNRTRTSVKRTATMTSVDSVWGGRRHQHLNIEGLSTAQLEEAALEAGVPLRTFLDVSDRDNERQRDRAQPMDGLPLHAHPNGAIVTALAQTHAAHAFDSSMSRGWPANPQTPTHAQLGRMAGMVTKFAVAVAVAHAAVPGAPRTPGVGEGQSGVQNGGEAPSQQPVPNASNSSASQSQTRQSRHGRSFMDIRQHPAAKWLKDFSRGANSRAEWTYEKFKADMAAEEKRAYYAKLTIAWSLFFVFWTVGSGIFSATEGWSYGSAMYFCFLAFTTTGYGDYSPQTPAGRSVFVVWALFGVGTLTILVSVVQEAGSSKYKSALHSHVFDKAVKKYRKKQLHESKQRPRPILEKHTSDGSNRSHNDSSTNAHSHSSHRQGPKPTDERLKESREVSQRALEALPGEIVRMARSFHQYMQFFVAGGADGLNPLDAQEASDEHGRLKIPSEMQDLLKELGDMEDISDRVRGEILQDEDARKTLFMLSLERSLKRLVTSAEKALSALADRDALASIASVAANDHTPPPERSTLSLSLPKRSDRTMVESDTDRERPESEPARPRSGHHHDIRTNTRRRPSYHTSPGESSRTQHHHQPVLPETSSLSSSSSTSLGG